MNHPNERELSAHLDGALAEADRRRIEQHLAGCAECHGALAALAAQDRALGGRLSHDPGDAYFESFAARVENRIRAAGLSGAQSHDERGLGFWEWLRTPSGLSWVGAAAAVIVGAGIVFMTGREIEMQNLHRPEWTERELRSSAPAGEKSARPELDQRNPAPAEEKRAKRADQSPAAPAAPLAQSAPEGAARDQAPGARPQHVIEVRRNQAGEDVPVHPTTGFATQPPAAASAGGESGPVYPVKPRRAEPMAAAPPAAKAATPATAAAPAVETPTTASANRASRSNESKAEISSVMTEASASRHCGTVLDPRGRPVANAQVIVAESGTTVASGADGGFCIDVPAAGRTLVVMAVGFEPLRERIVAEEHGPLALSLRPVPVLDGGLAMQYSKEAGHTSLASPSAPAPGAARAAQPGMLPESVSVMIATAERLEAEAGRAHAASPYEAAAVQWEKVLRHVLGGPAENGIRYHIAEARYHAWQAEPTHDRAAVAGESIHAYVARAPEGAERDLASRWLEKLSWSGNKALYR